MIFKKQKMRSLTGLNNMIKLTMNEKKQVSLIHFKNANLCFACDLLEWIKDWAIDNNYTNVRIGNDKGEWFEVTAIDNNDYEV